MRLHDELAFGAALNERDFDRQVENSGDPLRDDPSSSGCWW